MFCMVENGSKVSILKRLGEKKHQSTVSSTVKVNSFFISLLFGWKKIESAEPVKKVIGIVSSKQNN